MAGALLRSVSTKVSNSGFLFRRRVVLWALVAGVLALVWSYRNQVSTDQLEQLARGARARGLPASWADLGRQYPFQTGAFSYFLSLNSLITGLPRPPASAYAAAMGLTNSGRPVSSEVVAWMERNEVTATQLQQLLLDGVNGDFGVRRAAMGVDFPPTASDHQAAVTLLRTRAEWAVERGRMDAGGAALIAAVRLIRYNGGDYSLIGFIVRQSEIKSTHDSVQNLWAPGRGRLTEPQLRDLQLAFAQLLEAPTLSVVLRINWAAEMDLLRSSSNWMPELFGNSTRRDEFLGFLVGCAYAISGSRSADVHDYLRISDARCEASQGTLAQRQQRSQALDAESAGILKKWNRPLFRRKFSTFRASTEKNCGPPPGFEPW